MSDQYGIDANKHRPTDRTTLTLEARRLRDVHHFSPDDISHCLRITVEQVREMLGNPKEPQ